MRLVAFLVMGVVGLLTPYLLSSAATAGGAPQRSAQGRRPSQVRLERKPRIDYSHFSHSTHVIQQKLACESCHKFPTKNWKEVRKADAAFPDVAEFPQHSACLNCHRPQFFARERPAPIICSNCHVAVRPKDTTRFIFPSLGDTSDSTRPWPNFQPEFLINFPHDKHLDQVGLNAPNSEARPRFETVSWQQKEQPKEPKSCPVCHQTYQPQGKSDEEYVTRPPKDLGDNFWLKKGTFKTIPTSHTTCFSCHNQDLGIPPSPSECGGCHTLGQNQLAAVDFDATVAKQMNIVDQTALRIWRHRFSSGTYRHEGGDHPNISCLACHEVNSMKTVEPKTFKVQVRSCGGAEGCHITATTDEGGILNYEIDQRKTNPGFVCNKCHISFGKQPLPESHLAAITKSMKK